jgi:hypothetical protein
MELALVAAMKPNTFAGICTVCEGIASVVMMGSAAVGTGAGIACKAGVPSFLALNAFTTSDPPQPCRTSATSSASSIKESLLSASSLDTSESAQTRISVIKSLDLIVWPGI